MIAFIDVADVGRNVDGAVVTSIGELVAHEVCGHAYSQLARVYLPGANPVTAECFAVAMQNEYRSAIMGLTTQRPFYDMGGIQISMPQYQSPGVWLIVGRGTYVPAGMLTTH
jgi:hypothetical protein